MKVVFPLIKADSGSDVWTYNLAGALNKKGIEIEIKKFPHNYQYYPYFLSWKKSTFKADIVHANSYSAFAFAGQIPMVTTAHHIVHDPLFAIYQTLPQKIFHRMIFFFEQKSFKSAQKITAVSQYTSQKIKEFFGCPATVIHNGVDTHLFRPQKPENNLLDIDPTKIKLFFVGNMSKRKGFDLLEPIMDQLGPDYILISTSGLRENFKTIKNNIFVVGSLNDQELADFYNYCDIFLSPTRLEGFGLTVAEAMACGKPIITTNCSALPEIVIEGQSGYLCKMDSINHFVERIKTLGENPALQRRMGEFNRARVEENFSLEKMAQQYIDLYQSIL